jgi:hypothetical protein
LIPEETDISFWICWIPPPGSRGAKNRRRADPTPMTSLKKFFLDNVFASEMRFLIMDSSLQYFQRPRMNPRPARFLTDIQVHEPEDGRLKTTSATRSMMTEQRTARITNRTL